MRIRLAGLIMVAAAFCWTAGCDSSGGNMGIEKLAEWSNAD